jgi:hypothetical protein
MHHDRERLVADAMAFLGLGLLDRLGHERAPPNYQLAPLPRRLSALTHAAHTRRGGWSLEESVGQLPTNPRSPTWRRAGVSKWHCEERLRKRVALAVGRAPRGPVRVARRPLPPYLTAEKSLGSSPSYHWMERKLHRPHGRREGSDCVTEGRVCDSVPG